ncbi:MAG: uroporphyrinogen-III synthase [Caldilineaceae bacterium]
MRPDSLAGAPGGSAGSLSGGLPGGLSDDLPPSPIVGKRVVVTQAVHQAPELGALLAARGAVPHFYPCIAIEPPENTTELDKALAAAAAGYYDWLVVTSANTVLVLADRLQALGIAPGALADVRLAAIGVPTAEAVAHHLGRTADLVPDDSKAEGLVQALTAVTQRGQRMLVPQADIARPTLVQGLTAGGLDVTSLAAYRTTAGSGGVPLHELLAEGPGKGVDAITFTSPSTVRNLLARLAQESGAPVDPSTLQQVVLACIGPVTADAMQAAGLPPQVVASKQSLEGLVEALSAYYRDAK